MAVLCEALTAQPRSFETVLSMMAAWSRSSQRPPPVPASAWSISAARNQTATMMAGWGIDYAGGVVTMPMEVI